MYKVEKNFDKWTSPAFTGFRIELRRMCIDTNGQPIFSVGFIDYDDGYFEVENDLTIDQALMYVNKFTAENIYNYAEFAHEQKYDTFFECCRAIEINFRTEEKLRELHEELMEEGLI